MCSANVTTLRWNITVPNYPSATRLVTTDNVLAPIVVSTRTFNVTRNSSIGALPLVSTLLISSISSELVGTQVACTVNQIDSNSDVVISRQITTIDVIRVEENGNNNYYNILIHILYIKYHTYVQLGQIIHILLLLLQLLYRLPSSYKQ